MFGKSWSKILCIKQYQYATGNVLIYIVYLNKNDSLFHLLLVNTYDIIIQDLSLKEKREKFTCVRLIFHFESERCNFNEWITLFVWEKISIFLIVVIKISFHERFFHTFCNTFFNTFGSTFCKAAMLSPILSVILFAILVSIISAILFVILFAIFPVIFLS